jgi:hypothetical protein
MVIDNPDLNSPSGNTRVILLRGFSNRWSTPNENAKIASFGNITLIWVRQHSKTSQIYPNLFDVIGPALFVFRWKGVWISRSRSSLFFT